MYWMYWFPEFEPVIALYFEEVLGNHWGKTIQALRGDTICVNATAGISSFNLFWVMAYKLKGSWQGTYSCTHIFWAQDV